MPGKQQTGQQESAPMPLRTRLAHWLHGIASDLQHAGQWQHPRTTAAIAPRLDDGDGMGPGAGWTPLHRTGPHDRAFSDWLQDQTDALEAWRKNFMVRRIVTLTRSYVLGGGITISSEHPWVQRFAHEFLNHPRNQLPARYGQICDELTRAGEIFPVLFTNPVDGMSHVRFVPASQIRYIETDPDDYETELAYHETEPGALQGKVWLGTDNPAAWEPDTDGRLPPLMLHYAVNRPIGATRGEGDLTPILRWCLRYSNWLEDRVRLNRVRTRQQLLEIELADDTKVQERKRQVETEDPVRAGIYVHGPGEQVTAHSLEIGAGDAAPDGKALRLAIAAGANSALHYLGEGESANYATAREMGEPTARFYTERQQELCGFLLDLIEVAYRRKVACGLARPPASGDYQLHVAVTEAARADNAGLAMAARNIVEALATMRQHGWIDDPTAVRLAFKFAGETISDQEIHAILAACAVAPEESLTRTGRTVIADQRSQAILTACCEQSAATSHPRQDAAPVAVAGVATGVSPVTSCPPALKGRELPADDPGCTDSGKDPLQL
jgi:hypothetical protein